MCSTDPRGVSVAHRSGVPTFAFAIGAGPLRNLEERVAVRDGLNRMAGITVREIGAKRLLEEIGVEVPITVTADPAFLLRPEPGGHVIILAAIDERVKKIGRAHV